jgi:hypothetical protein
MWHEKIEARILKQAGIDVAQNVNVGLQFVKEG